MLAIYKPAFGRVGAPHFSGTHLEVTAVVKDWDLPFRTAEDSILDGVVLQMQQAGSADPGHWSLGCWFYRSSVLSHRENAGHLVSSPIVILHDIAFLGARTIQTKTLKRIGTYYHPQLFGPSHAIFFRGSLLVPKAMPSLPWWGAETFFGLRLLTLGFTQRIRRVPVRMGRWREGRPGAHDAYGWLGPPGPFLLKNEEKCVKVHGMKKPITHMLHVWHVCLHLGDF